MSILTIPVSEKFVKLRSERAAKFNKTNSPTSADLMRADCEIYEWHMAYMEGAWEPSSKWSYDGVSDKYGKVDVKIIDKWWNIDRNKMWNLCRQHAEVDFWYFIEKIDWPDRPLEAGDEVVVKFIGVMDFEDIMKHIQKSGYDHSGFYVDVRRHANG